MAYHNDWGFQQTGDPERTESISDGVRLEPLSTLCVGEIHTVTGGLDGSLDLIGGDMFGDRRIGGLALFAQDEVRILKDVTLTVGGRFDLESVGLTGEAGHLNPKAALLYRAGGGTSFRASFGEGFRVPSLPEAFVEAGSTGLLAVPNRDLKPERSRSYEAGVTQMLGDAGSIDIAAFRSDFDNLIEPGLFASGLNLEIQWRNVTEARVQGFETLMHGKVLRRGSGVQPRVHVCLPAGPDAQRHPEIPPPSRAPCRCPGNSRMAERLGRFPVLEQGRKDRRRTR